VEFVPAEEEDSRDDMDTTLPLRYLNKMKRYKAMRDKIPGNLPKTEPFQYNNTISTQATSYSELLMLCQKHGADKSICLMTLTLLIGTTIPSTRIPRHDVTILNSYP
jgi:hypothetical protein